MKNKLIKLINVKSIITILITIVFVILSIKNIVPVDSFLNVFLIIISFYFGNQLGKNETKDVN